MAKTRLPVGNEDINFFRCRRCGFPCDLQRDKIRPGLGISYSINSPAPTQDQAPYDHTVTFGCSQCGCGEYDKWQR